MATREREITEQDRAARVETLVRQLSETEQALQELLAGEVDAVIDPVRGTPIILRQAQAELRRSEARMRLLLERVPAVVWTTDSDLCVTSLGGKGANVLGVPSEALIGRSVEAVVEEHPRLAGLLAAHYRAMEGHPATYDVTLGERILHGTVEPLRDDGGQDGAGRIIGCVGLGLDVTRQRRMEDAFGGKLGAARRELGALATRSGELDSQHRALVEEVLESSFVAVEELQVAGEELRQQNEELIAVHNDLEASRWRYRDLFESAPDGYLVTDPAGVIRQVNQAAVELLGARREVLQGKPLVIYVAEGDRAEFHRRLGRVRAGQRAGSIEWELRVRNRARTNRAANGTADSGLFPAALTVSPIHDAQGELTGLRWLLRDISPSKRAQERERLLEEARVAAEETQAANQLLHTLLDTMPVGVVVCNAEGALLMTNAFGRDILGERVVGSVTHPQRTYTPHYPDGSPFPASEMPLTRAMALGETVGGVEILIRRDDGSERTILAGAAPVRDGKGKIVSGVTVFQDITARKRLETVIEEERARLHAIIRSAPEGIVVADAQARILMTNPAADALYARPVPYGEDYERHTSLALCWPDGVPCTPRDLPLTRAALDGEVVVNEELAIHWPDGQQRDLLINAAPVSRRSGEIIGAVAIFQDITERKWAEQTLRRYADRLRALHETDRAILAAGSIEKIAEAALAGVPQLLDCVRASVMLYDLDRGEMSLLAVRASEETRIGKDWQSAIDDEWAPMVQDLLRGATVTLEDVQQAPSDSPWREALREEQVQTLVAMPLLIEGQLIGSFNLGMARLGLLEKEERAIARQVAIQLAIGMRQARLLERIQRHADQLEDLVQERTAELRASQVRLQAIFDHAPVGIALLDLEGHVLDSNPALQALLGYDAQTLRGQYFKTFTHPDDVEADLALAAELMAGQRDFYRLEKRLIRQDGQVVWVNLYASGIQDAEGHLQYGLGLVDDVTEHKQAQEALIQSEKLAMTGQLAASMAHEINNPLQSVVGCLGLAQEIMEDQDLDSELGQFIGIAHEELQRAARIVSRLRDLGRPSDAERKERFDVNGLITRVLTLSAKQLDKHHVVAQQHLAEDLPAPRGVADQIQQVFLNLVLNAIDAMPDGGKLQVSTGYEKASEEVVITLVDTGPGMSPDVLSQLFEPFFSTKSEGVGLGLFVSQNIIREHGGRIEVESEMGQGSTFIVRLPLVGSS